MADDLESIVPADIEAEVDAIYNERYALSDARVAGETTATTKGRAAGVMAISGASFEEIAEVLGFHSARHAELAVQRSLADSLDSWDKAQLKKLLVGRYDTLFREGLRRSRTRGYFAREAAANTALKSLNEMVKMLGLATPTEHVVHGPAAAEIRVFVNKIVDQAVATLPEEHDVIEGHVVHELPPASGDA